MYYLRLLLILFVTFSYLKSFAQSFEFTYESGEQTILGWNFYEDTDESLYLLGTSHVYTQGVYGGETLTNNILKITSLGGLLEEAEYMTSSEVPPFREYNLPTQHLLLMENQILMPYCPYIGYLQYAPPYQSLFSYSEKRRLATIDKSTGDLLEVDTFSMIDGSYPSKHQIINMEAIGDQYRITYSNRDTSSSILFHYLDQETNHLYIDTINIDDVVFMPTSNSEIYLKVTRYGAKAFDAFTHELVQEFEFWADGILADFPPEQISGMSIETKDNLLYVRLLFEVTPGDRNTVMSIFDWSGQKIVQRIFPDYHSQDFSITDSGNVLLLLRLDDAVLNTDSSTMK